MGSCGELTLVDDPSGESVIEQHSCLELPVQSVTVQQFSEEAEACYELDSDVGISNVTDGCVQSSREGHVGPASSVDVTEMSRHALVGECENADMLVVEKTLEDDGGNCLRMCCGKVEVSSLESGRLCSEENVRDEGNHDMPSEFLTADGLQNPCVQQGKLKDDEGNIFPSAGDVLAVVEGKNNDTGSLTDACSCMLDFRHSEVSLESEPMIDLLVDCNKQNEQEDIMRNADPLSKVVGKCDALDGMEADACKQISPSHREVPSDVLHTEVDSRVDQLRGQKDGQDCNSSLEEKIRDFVDKECIIDKYVDVLSSSVSRRTLESSPCEPTMLDQGNEINLDMKNTILQIDDNFCKLMDCSSETTTNCTFGQPFYPESDQPTVVLITNNSSKDMPDLLPKGDNGSINYSNAVGNQGQTDNEDKDVAEVECITERIPLPSKRNSHRTKSGRKTQTKKASRKCKNKASFTHPVGGMKISLEAARKKRSCFSKPARSSIWGLLGNIKQVFEQDNELGVSKVMFQGLGKARSSHKSGKAIKRGASSSSLSSVQKCSVSTTRVRLKIKVGKEDLRCSNVLTPEVVDGLTSASYFGSGSGSQEVASNAEGKASEVVALGKFESFQNNLDEDALVLNGQIANSYVESTSIMEKSDGYAEELCLVVPRVVEALIEPINNEGMDSGTSPDSEVINSIPEVLVGEGHQEDVHLAVLGSFEEFNSHLGVTGSKRGKKKGKLTCSSITEDTQGPPRKNRAKHSKNHRRKKNSCDAVSSLELHTSTDINASSKSVSCKELSTEPLPLPEEIERGDSTEALEVKNCIDVKTTCDPSVDHGLSESQDSENLLSSARSLGRKLPKSLKPSKVSKPKSKASDSPSRKMTTCRRKGKKQKPIKNSEVKGKGVSDKVMCEVEDRSHTANDLVGNHKLDAGDNRVSIDVSNLDMVPAVGFGEQHLSPRNAWVRCDDCHKWRRIPVVLADLIEETNCTWTCKDSNDKAFADCSIPQEKSNGEINAELGLSDASGEEDAYEDSKNYKELQYRPPLVSQESTFTCIFNNEFLHRSCKTQTIDEIMVCHCIPPTEGKLGCGDECLNRMLNIECVQGTCPCGDHCSNQQFQRRKYASLKWFKCGKKGYGLKALEGIAKGQFLIEYVGEVLDVHAYEARQREYALKGHRHFYFMTLNGSEVIDASAKGNLGRFINHSCDPNCRTEKWMVNGEICIGLFALRDIKQDEEVTFDYNYVRVFGAAAKKCYCGSPHCRGYIGGDPHDAEVIVQGDSDEEFPEPVMLTEEGEIEDSLPIPKYFDNVSMQTARPMLKDSYVSDRPTTDIVPIVTPEKQSSTNPVSAISLMHNSLEVEDTEGKLPTSVQVEEISQQMEDVTSKPMPAAKQGYAMESDLVDKTSSIQRSETTSSLTTASKVSMNSIDSNRGSKSEIVEGGHGLPQSNLLVKAPRLNGSVKKGKLRANPSNGLKAEVATNQLQVSSIKIKKFVEGSSNGRFEAVQEKLNELLDGDGGISKRKDATKGYLKLLLLTVASGDRSNGEAIQSNRDLSMILDALLKTKSRAVLNDIINKNGLQMLHKIMKQYRRDFKKIPILRKLLKVLEYLAASKILTFEHINGGPPCHGMESFRDSMLYLTEHDDKQVHQIARSFRDRWIPRAVRKHGYMDRDDNRVEFHRSFNCNRFLTSHNNRHEQDIRSTEANDCVQQSMLETTLVDAGAQEVCSATCLDGVEINETKKHKRKSRWDQPAETNSHSVPYPSKEQKIGSGLLKQTDAVISSADARKNIPEDVPPGFSCPLGSLNASLNSGDLALQNAGHSGCPSDAVIGHPKEKFNSSFPVSYGLPWSVAQQYGTPHAKIAESWITAPGMPFNPFPPLPPYPRNRKDSQPSNTTDALTIDQPADEVRQRNPSGLVSCNSDDMIPSTTGANPEDMKLSYEDNKHISKRMKDASYDLGRRYFRQQKWNNSKIPRPWSRRNEWKCNENNSMGDMCSSISVGNVPNESKVTCHSEDAICRADIDGNNI